MNSKLNSNVNSTANNKPAKLTAVSPTKSKLSVAIVMCLTGIAATLPMQSYAATVNNQITSASSQQTYNIAAGALTDALLRFAAESKITIQFDTRLTKGLNTSGLQGEYSITNGLTTLLQGSTLSLEKVTDSVYTLKKSADKIVGTLALTTITSGSTKDGSAEAGYRVEKTKNIGAFSGKAIIDTPYSIAVLPSSLLENTVASSIDQVFRMSPTIQINTPSNFSDYPSVTMRGFASTQGLLDGISVNTQGLSIEEMDQVEILTGTSGFLYGPGNVGGRVNYVYKRPTQERLTKVTVGNYGGSQYFVHADLGGNIDDDGMFGYRVNIVKQDGETTIEDENIDKFLISGALDWHISESLLAQVVLSHRDYKIDGKQGAWYTRTTAAAFDAPDTSKAYGPEWASIDNETNSVKFDLTWNINEVFTLRSAYLNKQVDTPMRNYFDNWHISENYLSWYEEQGAEVGDFVQYNAILENLKRESSGANIFLDAVFNTGSTEHNMTLGYSSGKKTGSYGEGKYFEEVYSNIEDLNTTVEPDWSTLSVSSEGRFQESSNTNVFIADEIMFNEQWSTQLGLNYTSLKARSGTESSGWGEGYDSSAFTPTVSILYKPQVNLTTYFTYMEALEEGTVVDEYYYNGGEVLEPFKSKEIEIGAKYELSGADLLLTAALFRIEQPNEFESENSLGQFIYTQDGLAVHQGLELGFSGKATENLTLLGGLTLLDATTQDSDDTDLEGEGIAGVANTMAKIYAEYAFPAISDLVLTGGVYYTGSATWYQGEDYKTDAYTLVDIGLRYSTTLADTPMAFRLAVTNLTDKDYWVNREYLGTPRSIAFSMSADF